MVHSTPDQPAESARGPDLTPEQEAAAEIEAGRRLFAAPCRFVHGAQTLEQLPAIDGPEIAFAGRSNVGKSSLINALTNQHALARASNQPGRTRQLNFFDLGGRLALVDMPGYGFAQAAKEIKEDWQGLMFEFLRGRPTLRRVLLLLDARIEVKESDNAVMDLLDHAAVSFQIVLTKADSTRPPALRRKQEEAGQLARQHPAAHPIVLCTSADTGDGVPDLRATLATLAKQAVLF